MSNLFTMGCCYNSSEITTKPPEMAIKSELWNINFIKCYSLIFSMKELSGLANS